jgi:Na+-driven multidrug efflux pump
MNLKIKKAIAANIRVGQFLGSNKPEEAINAAKVTYALTGKTINLEFNLILKYFNQ